MVVFQISSYSRARVCDHGFLLCTAALQINSSESKSKHCIYLNLYNPQAWANLILKSCLILLSISLSLSLTPSTHPCNGNRFNPPHKLNSARLNPKLIRTRAQLDNLGKATPTELVIRKPDSITPGITIYKIRHQSEYLGWGSDDL